MNNFKTLLYILLASYLLGFNVAQAQWQNDTKGCKVWVEGQTTGQAPIWSGQCRDGFASGKGKITYQYRAASEVKSCTGTMNKGKIQGYANCLFKTGDTFSGTIKNDKIEGRGVYKWSPRKNCKNCPLQYSGTFHHGAFALGTVIMTSGQKVPVKYYTTRQGCLVWNSEPKPHEVISWSGQCKGGYGSGRGILQYSSPTETETTHGTLVIGMLEGHAVLDSRHTPACKNCVIHYEGKFKFHKAIKGVATLANGKKVKHDPQIQRMEKLLSDSTRFQLAMMKLQTQMSNTRAMGDVSATASCYMSPGCEMRYESVPSY